MWQDAYSKVLSTVNINILGIFFFLGAFFVKENNNDNVCRYFGCTVTGRVFLRWIFQFHTV